jgi:hypothetical protein
MKAVSNPILQFNRRWPQLLPTAATPSATCEPNAARATAKLLSPGEIRVNAEYQSNQRTSRETSVGGMKEDLTTVGRGRTCCASNELALPVQANGPCHPLRAWEGALFASTGWSAEGTPARAWTENHQACAGPQPGGSRGFERPLGGALSEPGVSLSVQRARAVVVCYRSARLLCSGDRRDPRLARH